MHTATKFTADGKLLMELGAKGQPSDTGCTQYTAYWQVKRSAGPFNQSTKAIESLWGDIYVTDGYGNARVHVFSPDVKPKFSWGDPGTGPGQFRIPHDIVTDKQGTLFVTEIDGMAHATLYP